MATNGVRKWCSTCHAWEEFTALGVCTTCGKEPDKNVSRVVTLQSRLEELERRFVDLERKVQEMRLSSHSEE